MKQVLFFTQNRWAFGSIHHALAKEFWLHGHYANLLDWTINYGEEEFKLLRDSYDIFVTMPDAVLSLHYRYGVELERIVTIAHGQWDILLAKQQADQDFYPKLKGFGVISRVLKEKCKEWQISRIPDIVELGIHTSVYSGQIPDRLENVGYAGDKEVKNWFGEEIKRSGLVERAVDASGLELNRHQFYNHLAMPGYYRRVGAVVMSSTEEAGGLPMMECAAAGRLPIGTPVGYFEDNAPKGGGILVPMEAEEFVDVTRMVLSNYKSSPRLYRMKCESVREYAIQNYDWSVKVGEWIKLICE